MIDGLDYPTPWPDVLHRGTPRDRTSAAAECAAEALEEVRREQKRERDLLLLNGAPAGPVGGIAPRCPDNQPARPTDSR